MSLRKRLYNYLKEWYSIDPDKWFHKDELVTLAQEVGYNAENCARRLGDLSEGDKPLLDKKENDRGSILYRYNPNNDAVAIIWRETEKRNQLNLI